MKVADHAVIKAAGSSSESLEDAIFIPIVSVASLGFLLGAVGAKAGGADIIRATARVTFWGALAMIATAGIGKLFGAVV